MCTFIASRIIKLKRVIAIERAENKKKKNRKLKRRTDNNDEQHKKKGLEMDERN